MCYHPLFCFNQFGDCEEASDAGRQRRGANSRGRLTLAPSSDHLVTMKEVIFSSMD